MLAAERSQRQRIATKPMRIEPSTKNTELNDIFVKMAPVIVKSVLGAKVQKEKLAENQQRLVTYGLAQIEQILMRNSSRRNDTFRPIEKKIHERLAGHCAKWMEGILGEMVNGHLLDAEQQQSTERLVEHIKRQLI